MSAIDEADLVVAVGYDIAEYSPEFWNPKREKRIIHVDFLPAEIYEYYQPDVEIVSDVSGALWNLNTEAEREYRFRFVLDQVSASENHRRRQFLQIKGWR